MTEVEVVRVEQELRQVEELWNEFLDISHVVFGSRHPGILDAMKHSISQIEVTALRDT